MTSHYDTLLRHALPWIPYGEGRIASSLPATSAVYLALTMDNAILYVGKSANLRQRWITRHYRNRLYQAGCVRLAWQVCPQSELNDLEVACWLRYQPTLGKFNGVLTQSAQAIADLLPTILTLEVHTRYTQSPQERAASNASRHFQR
jgi:excinuclease UvrABC nuclease subunit